MDDIATLRAIKDDPRAEILAQLHIEPQIIPKLTESEIDELMASQLKKAQSILLKLLVNPIETQSVNKAILFTRPPTLLHTYLSRNCAPLFQCINDIIRLMFRIPFTPPQPLDQKKKQCRIRIGFCSFALSRLTSVIRDSIGIMQTLPKTLFEVYAILLAPVENEVVARMLAPLEHVVLLQPPQNGHEAPHEWLATRVKALDLDIIVWNDMGMNALCGSLLAMHRVAPVSVCRWGHSDTSGGIADYYTTSKLYELEDLTEAASHYTEEVLFQPGMCTHYFNPFDDAFIAASLAEKPRLYYALPSTHHIYLCFQSTFKFQRRFTEEMLVPILRQDPLAILVFCRCDFFSTKWEREFYANFEAVLTPELFARTRHIERQNMAGVIALIGAADVVIDSFPFSGCNTSLETFSVGKPVVTRPGDFINGRFTLGFYKVMDWLEMVADTSEEYVRIALRLANDLEYRRHAEAEVKARAHKLWKDPQTTKDWTEDMQKIARVQLVSREEVWRRPLLAAVAALRSIPSLKWWLSHGAGVAAAKDAQTEPVPSALSGIDIALDVGSMPDTPAAVLHAQLNLAFRRQGFMGEVAPHEDASVYLHYLQVFELSRVPVRLRWVWRTPLVSLPTGADPQTTFIPPSAYCAGRWTPPFTLQTLGVEQPSQVLFHLWLTQPSLNVGPVDSRPSPEESVIDASGSGGVIEVPPLPTHESLKHKWLGIPVQLHGAREWALELYRGEVLPEHEGPAREDCVAASVRFATVLMFGIFDGKDGEPLEMLVAGAQRAWVPPAILERKASKTAPPGSPEPVRQATVVIGLYDDAAAAAYRQGRAARGKVSAEVASERIVPFEERRVAVLKRVAEGVSHATRIEVVCLPLGDHAPFFKSVLERSAQLNRLSDGSFMGAATVRQHMEPPNVVSGMELLSLNTPVLFWKNV